MLNMLHNLKPYELHPSPNGIGAGIAACVQRRAILWTVWVWNTGRGEVFYLHQNRPDRFRGPHTLLLNDGIAAGTWR